MSEGCPKCGYEIPHWPGSPDCYERQIATLQERLEAWRSVVIYCNRTKEVCPVEGCKCFQCQKYDRLKELGEID